MSEVGIGGSRGGKGSKVQLLYLLQTVILQESTCRHCVQAQLTSKLRGKERRSFPRDLGETGTSGDKTGRRARIIDDPVIYTIYIKPSF